MGKIFKNLFGGNEQKPITPATPAVKAPDSLNETEQERVISNRSNQRKQRATGKRALQISTVGSNVGSNGAGTNV